MKISVFGLGYVGSVTAACLADRGFFVIGVDINQDKVDWINRQKSPVLEKGLEQCIERSVKNGRLVATTDVCEAVAKSDVSLVCVGTPSKPNGDLDLQFVNRVAEQIGNALKAKAAYHTVVFRSTMLPGTTMDKMRPILEKHSGKLVGNELGLCFNPEFLREGSAIADFQQPPFTIVGVENAVDAEVVKQLYGGIDAELIVVGVKIAETIKYICNCYHALKVTFANEVGRYCRALQIDSHEVMEIFCKDTKQNLSSCYLTPGFAFGGSCLPKDLRAILYQAKTLDVPMEVLNAVLPSNRAQIDLGVQLVGEAGNKKVGLLGLSFKAGTDDLRESPLVALAEMLHGRGYEVRIFDEHVSLSRLVGANRSYIEQQLPHVGAMFLDSREAVVKHGDTIVIGNKTHSCKDLLARIPPEKRVIDLVRVAKQFDGVKCDYHGISW
jgi:GDP-mannose 6-dehydrogenase